MEEHVNLIDTFAEFKESKSIDRETLMHILEDVFRAALVKKYGGQISFMGGINNGIVDVPDWKADEVRAYVEQMCRDCGPLYFIPGMTAGGPGSSFGVYDTVTAEINRMSEIMFK